MNWQTTLRILCLATAGACAAASADSVCVKGNRDVTPAERATMTRVLETVRAALPPAPADWVVVSDDSLSVPKSYCRDFEPSPWHYRFSRHYSNQNTQRREAGERALADAAATSQSEMAQKQPRLDAIMAKMNALVPQVQAAEQKGDAAKAQKLRTEYETLSQEYTRVIEGGDSAAQMAAAGAAMSHDLEMTISVDVNPGKVAAAQGMTKLSARPGSQVAVRWNTQHEAATNGHALVLLGQWAPAAQRSGWTAVVPANAALPAAHAYSVRIEADPARIEQTLQSIDFASLARSLQH